MSVGFTKNKADLDQRGGSIALDLRGVMDRIRVYKAIMDTLTDQNLLDLGYTSTEKDQLRSSFVDLDQLRTVYEGTGTRTPAYDYRTFSKLLTGVV